MELALESYRKTTTKKNGVTDFKVNNVCLNLLSGNAKKAVSKKI